MKASTTSRAQVVTKAQTSKSKAKAKKGKTYTAAQQQQYAWLKQHYPFPKTSTSKAKATAAKAGKSSTKAKTTATAGTTRTLSLFPHHRNNLTEGSDVKLGRNAPYAAADKPRLVLDDYLTGAVAPAVVDFGSEVLSWPMYGNDTIGDCTAACVGHQIQAWTRYTGAEVTVPQEDIIELYSAVSGYDPATGANDNGAVIQDVLTYWRKSGVPVAGHKILAFAQLKDYSKIKDALWMFGSVYLGIAFPQSAMDQFNAGQPWTVSGDGTIVGGHAIPIQYAGTGTVPYQVVTWAKLQGMDQGFLDTYAGATQGGEAWVIITDDWLEKNGHTPEGLDLQALGADLSALTGDPNPFPAPPSPAPPAPPAPAPAPPAPSPDPALLRQIEQDAEQILADIEKAL